MHVFAKGREPTSAEQVERDFNEASDEAARGHSIFDRPYGKEKVVFSAMAARRLLKTVTRASIYPQSGCSKSELGDPEGYGSLLPGYRWLLVEEGCLENVLMSGDRIMNRSEAEPLNLVTITIRRVGAGGALRRR